MFLYSSIWITYNNDNHNALFTTSITFETSVIYLCFWGENYYFILFFVTPSLMDLMYRNKRLNVFNIRTAYARDFSLDKHKTDC